MSPCSSALSCYNWRTCTATSGYSKASCASLWPNTWYTPITLVFHVSSMEGTYQADQSDVAVGKQFHLFHNYSADWQSNQHLTETGTSPSLPRCVFSMALVWVSEWSHATQRWMRSPDGTGDLVNICRRVHSNLLVLVLGTNERWELIISICNYNWIIRCASYEIGWNYNFQKELQLIQLITIYHKPISLLWRFATNCNLLVQL